MPKLGRKEGEMKKYEFIGEVIQIDGHNLKRIRALIDFGKVKANEIGGYIESENNLSHSGDAWIYGNAQVSGNAQVYGDARVCGDAQVSGDAQVCGDARVSGDALVSGENDIFTIGPIGSRQDITTFFKTCTGYIGVRCGCFWGTLQDFLDKVNERHGDNEFGQAYRLAAEIAKLKMENK